VGVHVRTWALSALVGAGIAGTAAAQQQASSFFTGVPTTVRNVAFDASNAVTQKPAQAALTGNRFDFSRLFRRQQIPGFPPKTGVSPLPAPSSFPSTKYQNFKMVGKPPFLINWMFGGSQSHPIAPVPPIIPGQKSPVGPGS
jgi:hypothetical protein